MILPSSTINYELPTIHEHPYYQCAVLGVTDSCDYKILSYSNKVDNPWRCTALHIETVEDGDLFDYCLSQDDTRDVVVYGDPDCPTQYWEWESDGETVIHTGYSVLFANGHETRTWDVVYHGCDREVPFRVMFYEPDWEDPFGEPVVWKRQGEAAVLTAVADEVYAEGDMECLWSTGDTTNRIEVTVPGLYSVTLAAHGCSDTFAVEMRDNVEILNATVELADGRNKVSWRTTPEQAGYIDKVKVILDGSAYSAPYDQGYYQFSGTGNTSRNYRLVSVTKGGEECPLASRERGTVHATYDQDSEGNLNIAWNVPYLEPGAPDELTGFQICKYDPSTQEVTVIEQLDASVTAYSGCAGLCADSKVVVAAVFNRNISPFGGDGQRPEELEYRSFSNSFTTLAVEEHGAEGFKVYPNPTDGTITVETVHAPSPQEQTEYRIINLMGQTLMTGSMSDTTIDVSTLLPGMYFLVFGEKTVKFVKQ